MPKTSVSDWDPVAANNTDIDGVDIDENCAPSGVNNAIRSIMAQIAVLDPTGISGGNFTGTWNFTGAIVTYPSGSTIQELSDTAIAADQIWYGTGANQLAVTALGTYARSFIASDSRVDARDSLLLGNAATFDVANTAEAEAGALDTVLMSPFRTEQYVDANCIGHDQTWLDVTLSRVAGTSYQNTTGRPIMVNVMCNGSDTLEVSTDNATWMIVATGIGGGSNDTLVAAIVPATQYYRLNGANFADWKELR